MRLYLQEFPDLKLAHVRPIDFLCCPLLQYQTLLQKRHILLSDSQCLHPLQATMTTSNKVAALPNPKLTMQQCPCGLHEFPDLKLAFVYHVDLLCCPLPQNQIIFKKKTYFALRSTMYTTIASDYDNVEQSCSASKF